MILSSTSYFFGMLSSEWNLYNLFFLSPHRHLLFCLQKVPLIRKIWQLWHMLSIVCFMYDKLTTLCTFSYIIHIQHIKLETQYSTLTLSCIDSRNYHERRRTELQTIKYLNKKTLLVNLPHFNVYIHCSISLTTI